MNTLRAEVVRLADGTIRMSLHGALDERAEPAALFEPVDADVTMNLRGLERVNSIGIHRWVPAITALSERFRVTLEEIPYSLVLAANAVANLFGQAKPGSCLAPYFCGTCRESRTEVVPAAEVGPDGEAPARACSACRSALSFDELDTYFRFLRRRRPR